MPPTTQPKSSAPRAGAGAAIASSRPSRTRRAYSTGRSSTSSCSGMTPLKITVSIGNFSGRRWPLKKWKVKMKPTASSASSPWTSVAMLNIQPGRKLAKNTGNHSSSPDPPMMNIPQNTAQ
ncbi:MAG: hypothetical protein IPO82_11250 [Betaproteobacteria bacterium]|nr:hypothetical protein [Betaproteobacteria bacterium]